MKIRNFVVMFVVLNALVFSSYSVANNGAWWEICDTCTSDADFHSRALSIPLTYTEVFVSNTSTNQTQQFFRTVSEEEIGGTMFITIDAVRVILPPSTEEAFKTTIDNSSSALVSIPRNNFDSLAGGGRDSIVGDLETGRINPALLTAIQVHLRMENHEGHIDRLSQAIGRAINILSRNNQFDQSGFLRKIPLVVRIPYPNGSTLMLTLSPDLQSWSQISLQDDDGQFIELEDPNDPASLVDLLGFNHVFDTANQIFLNNLLSNIDQRDGYTCRAEVIEDRTTVTYTRSL